MNKLYIARLIISFDDDWGLSCNFNYTKVVGKFIKNETTGVYEGLDEDRGAWVQAPLVMRSKEYRNTLEVVQGFDKYLSETELEELKIDMKLSILNLLKEYKDNYLKDYNKKVSYIKNTTVA